MGCTPTVHTMERKKSHALFKALPSVKLSGCDVPLLDPQHHWTAALSPATGQCPSAKKKLHKVPLLPWTTSSFSQTSSSPSSATLIPEHALIDFVLLHTTEWFWCTRSNMSKSAVSERHQEICTSFPPLKNHQRHSFPERKENTFNTLTTNQKVFYSWFHLCWQNEADVNRQTGRQGSAHAVPTSGLWWR